MFKKIAIKIRQLILGKRFDDDHTLHYFTHNDYENMTCEKFDFISNDIKLQGYLYGVTPLEHKGIIIFVHGMGAGHIQYTNDIHYYCALGYDVYTFDGQGCLNSSGDSLDYFSNYIRNLSDFISFLKQKKELQGSKFILIGHSMGGYAVNIISKLHKDDIECIVSMAGFNHVKQLLEDQLTLPNFLKKSIAKEIAKQDKKNAPEYSLNTIDVIKETNVKILFIAGEKDPLVFKSSNYDVLKANLFSLNNTYFLLVKDRLHNPYVSKESANYFKETRKQFNELSMKFNNKIPNEELNNYYDSLNYKLLVDLDENVMDIIKSFISGEKIAKETIIE